MRYEGSLSFRSPPTAVWQALTNPEKLSTCMPGLVAWQTITPNETFHLKLSWWSETEHVILIPVRLQWAPQQNWRLVITAVATVGGSHSVTADGTVSLQSIPADETELTFVGSVTTPNKMMDQMAHAAIPKMTSRFFKCFRQMVDTGAAGAGM